MSVQSIEALQRYLRRLCDEAMPPEDAVLLERFVTANDREAFELLIARHGPMVLGTARRLVQNTHDAEDVFQAVFLSLARLAKSIRQGRALPAWLHRTTCRAAARVRANRRLPNAPPPERYEQGDPAAGLFQPAGLPPGREGAGRADRRPAAGRAEVPGVGQRSDRSRHAARRGGQVR